MAAGPGAPSTQAWPPSTKAATPHLPEDPGACLVDPPHRFGKGC